MWELSNLLMTFSLTFLIGDCMSIGLIFWIGGLFVPSLESRNSLELLSLSLCPLLNQFSSPCISESPLSFSLSQVSDMRSGAMALLVESPLRTSVRSLLELPYR